MNNYGTRESESRETRARAESVIKRVFEAVEHLATGKGDVRKRLIVAVMILVPLKAEEFPEELRNDFIWVVAQSTKYLPFVPGEGSIEATMRQIQNSTGEKIAKRIFHIYSRLQDIRGFPLLEHRHPND